MLVSLVGLVLLAPFLLFLGRKPLNGRRFLVIFVGLFAVIIGANLVMAVQAVRSFPGLEVANSYVASQQFDDARSAQQALGWLVEPRYDNGLLTLKISDGQGLPAPVQALRVTVSRPTQKRDDVTPEMRYSGGLWMADVPLAPGAWVVHLEAEAPDGTAFRQRLAHYPGSIVRN
ncbi:FixH family protein [Paracoccus sp. 12-3]|nr:FixH family protein [Paracoccus xiamenensis]